MTINTSNSYGGSFANLNAVNNLNYGQMPQYGGLGIFSNKSAAIAKIEQKLASLQFQKQAAGSNYPEVISQFEIIENKLLQELNLLKSGNSYNNYNSYGFDPIIAQKRTVLAYQAQAASASNPELISQYLAADNQLLQGFNGFDGRNTLSKIAQLEQQRRDLGAIAQVAAENYPEVAQQLFEKDQQLKQEINTLKAQDTQQTQPPQNQFMQLLMTMFSMFMGKQ